MTMHSPGRWQPSVPWLRVWPVAAIVIALHAAFLQGWQLADGGGARAGPIASTMIVRLLTASPAAAEAPVAAVVAAARPPEATRPAAETAAAAGRTSVAPTGPAANASRPVVASPARTAPPGSDYLLGSRLDPPPRLLEVTEPAYPAEAGLAEGSVVLRLLIAATGAVDEVTVVRATPKGVFDASAVASFSAARFSPGKVLGVPVKSQVTIEVHFTPVDRGANVTAPTY